MSVDNPSALAEEAITHLLARGLIGHPSREDLRTLAAGLVLSRYDIGQAVISEGEMGDALYITLDGSASVLIGSKDGERLVAKIGRGDIFGEQAITSWFPRRRTATVKADGPLLCARLDRVSYRTFADADAVRRAENTGTDQAIGRLRAVSRTLSLMPEAAILSVPWQTVDLLRGGPVFQRGEPADRAYFVVQGAVILQREDGHPVASFTKGHIFGQHGLTTGAPRTVDAVADPNTQLLAVAAADWPRLAGMPDHAKALSATLAGAYSTPDRGTVLLSERTTNNEATLSAEFQLPDGRRVLSLRLPGQTAFRMSLQNATEDRRSQYPAPTGRIREIALNAEGQITEVIAVGPWASLPALCGHLLSGIALTPDDERILSLGKPLIDRSGPTCHCLAADADLIAELAIGGADSPAAVTAACGAGGPCGGCEVAIANLLLPPT